MAVDLLAQLAHEALVKACREDPKVFMRYVMQTKDRRPWDVQPFHDEWQDALTENPRLGLLAPVEHGKTEQVVIGRLLWELGRDPTHTCAVICASGSAAEERGDALRAWIAGECLDADDNDRLHEVFPDLLPGKHWNRTKFDIKGKSPGSKDPSVCLIGTGAKLPGKRLTILIIDDPHDDENTSTKAQREKTIRWFDNSAYARVCEDGKIWIIHTSWHATEDLIHTLKGRGWRVLTYRAIDKDWQTPLWPSRWSIPRLRQFKADIGPQAFARQALNFPYDDSSSRFREEDFAYALQKGQEELGEPILSCEEPGEWIVIGVDLAVSKKKDADRTSFAICRRKTNGERQLLNVESGRWSAPEILERIDDLHYRYGNPIFWVENNAAQDYLIQLAPHLTSANVRAHTTGVGKRSMIYAIELLAAELAGHKWAIASIDGKTAPNDAIDTFIEGAMSFTPGSHPVDELASVAIAAQHIDFGMRKIRSIQNIYMVA